MFRILKFFLVIYTTFFFSGDMYLRICPSSIEIFFKAHPCQTTNTGLHDPFFMCVTHQIYTHIEPYQYGSSTGYLKPLGFNFPIYVNCVSSSPRFCDVHLIILKLIIVCNQHGSPGQLLYQHITILSR